MNSGNNNSLVEQCGDDISSSRRAPIYSHSHTRMQTRSFTNYWSIEQFSIQQELHSSGDCIVAPKFGDSQYEFQLKLFPNGKDDDNTGYLSLFLQINKCPLPRLQFRVSFTVETLDGPRPCALNKNVVTINKSGIVTASKFFSHEVLKNCASRYLPNDVLTIGVELTVYGENQSIAHEDMNATMGTCRYLSADKFSADEKELDGDDSLVKVLESGEFSDFTVVSSDGKEFKVHKCVLSSRSEYFSALLKASTKESAEGKVVLNDITSDDLALIMRHIYSPSSPCPASHMNIDLMIAADRMMLESLKRECAATFVEGLTAKNVASRLILAEDLRLDKLFDKLVRFFCINKSEIIRLPEWQELRVSNPVLAARVLEETMTILDDVPTSSKRVRLSK